MANGSTFWGVYRVLKSGRLVYLERSATASRKLAEEIAAERSRGEVTLPTGRVVNTAAYPHVAKPIGKKESSQ